MGGQYRPNALAELDPAFAKPYGRGLEGVDIARRQVGQRVDARRERISLVAQAVIP